jgi:WD40 repeat protein
MSNARTDTPSIAARTRTVGTGAPIVAAHFLGNMAAFVLGEEALLFVPPQGDERRVAIHAGAILESAADGKRLVTGGDDGKVVVTDAAGESEILARDDKKRWIDHVALAPGGAAAWSAGKTAFVAVAKSGPRALDVASTVGGLAFAPKGLRLAIAHYNGATLWFPNTQAAPEFLEWKGSHHDVTFSPDGNFLVTAMQEPTLHGWRIEDRKHMRMSGYAARVRSLAWSADGRFLATGGSDQLILWPFGKDGPIGETPRLLAPHAARLAVVACHPKQPIAACGFSDGMVVLVRIDGGAKFLARPPDAAPISALAFSADGALLAFGCDDGEAGIVALQASPAKRADKKPRKPR